MKQKLNETGQPSTEAGERDGDKRGYGNTEVVNGHGALTLVPSDAK